MVMSGFHNLKQARTGAFRALTRLREEGVIKGWGLGVNKVESIELMLDLEEAQPNISLLAGRYSLLDHERALQRVMPAAVKHNMDIVVGGPYRLRYSCWRCSLRISKASPEIIAKVEKIKALADRHEISIKAAALQFSLANPAVAAVVPGASKPNEL